MNHRSDVIPNAARDLDRRIPRCARNDERAVDPLRREFLKLGLAGATALSAASLGATLAGCTRREEAAAAGHAWLRDGDVTLLRALIPAILDGSLPAAGDARAKRVAETLARVDFAGARYAPSTQAALRRLFDLMSFAPTRRLACGIGPWAQADAPALAAFLERWRGSRIGAFNAGYRALTRMVSLAHFTLPATWPATGYPGPLEWVYRAANG